MKYLCAQPATKYYAWQIDVMLYSFKEQGVALDNCHVVCAKHGEVDDHFNVMINKYPGVTFAFYEDTRLDRRYISSIRPHIIQKHYEANPTLFTDSVFYHDCDIALVKPLAEEKLERDDVCYVSDTISYIGYDYILSKGRDVLDKMLSIMAIDEETVKKNQWHSGGAQYVIKNVDKYYWMDVERDSNRLFAEVTELNNQKKAVDPAHHELQIWCSDMWAVLWNLWKRGKHTMVVPEMDFTWSTSSVTTWGEHAIYHNAGVVGEAKDRQFFKAEFMEEFPALDREYETNTCGFKYYEIVKKALTGTKHLIEVYDQDNIKIV